MTNRKPKWKAIGTIPAETAPVRQGKWKLLYEEVFRMLKQADPKEICFVTFDTFEDACKAYAGLQHYLRNKKITLQRHGCDLYVYRGENWDTSEDSELAIRPSVAFQPGKPSADVSTRKKIDDSES